jgi:hypothetical protein
MPVIWVRTKAEYFCGMGWTGFTDLPVRLKCRRLLPEIVLALEANQSVARMSAAICGAQSDVSDLCLFATPQRTDAMGQHAANEAPVSEVRQSYLQRRRIFLAVRRDRTLPSRFALAATRLRY